MFQRYWWGRLNRRLFQGRLPVPAGFSVHTSESSHELGLGETWAWYWPTDSAGLGAFSFWDKPVTKRQFIATMIHEMIHQLQHLEGRPLVHGRYFKVACAYYGRRLCIPIS